jgi:PAS domain-containing protein
LTQVFRGRPSGPRWTSDAERRTSVSGTGCALKCRAIHATPLPALDLLDLLPTAILGVGLLGEIVYANPAFAVMLGYSDGRAVSRVPLPELLAGRAAAGEGGARAVEIRSATWA